MVTPPLPPADAAYGRDVDRAYRVYGHAILALLGPYTREKNLRRAMDTFNAAVREQDIVGTFERSIAAAQVALRERHAARYAKPRTVDITEELEELAAAARAAQLARADASAIADDDIPPEEDW